MPRYVIERTLPGAGNLTPEQLKAIAQTSNRTNANLGSQIQWKQSYVVGDKIYCDWVAPSEEIVREHARQAGFPCDSVKEVKSLLGPETAES